MPEITYASSSLNKIDNELYRKYSTLGKVNVQSLIYAKCKNHPV